MKMNSRSSKLQRRNWISLSLAGGFLGVLAIISQVAFAGVLTLSPSGKSIENVSIAQSASAVIGGRQFNLTTVGAGLRSKKVTFLHVRVYVAQLMVSDASRFVRTSDGALDSVSKMNQAAIRMDFLRSVDAQTVQSSFRDSFLANHVDMNRPEIHAFLDAVTAGGDALNGRALTIVGEKLSDGSEAVTYEDSNGKDTTIQGPTGFIREIFSIWLGNPSDSGVANLKSALIGSS